MRDAWLSRMALAAQTAKFSKLLSDIGDRPGAAAYCRSRSACSVAATTPRVSDGSAELPESGCEIGVGTTRA